MMMMMIMMTMMMGIVMMKTMMLMMLPSGLHSFAPLFTVVVIVLLFLAEFVI